MRGSADEILDGNARNVPEPHHVGSGRGDSLQAGVQWNSEFDLDIRQQSQSHHPHALLLLEGGSPGSPAQVLSTLDGLCRADHILCPIARIPRRRHRHIRRLPREDRREDFGVSGDFPVQLATGINSFYTSRTRTRIIADLSDTRDFTREDPREDVR